MSSKPSAAPKEVVLGDDDLVVSQTDLRGRITYVSKDFVAISGYGESELLGQPHNLVRHPDMPAEVFEDLWRTLKAGRPWVGYVKNRCKNGDYYWVLANVAPLAEKGHVTGYLSVRRKVTASKVAEMEELYRLFRDKRQGSLRFRFGRVVKGERDGLLANLGMTARIAGTMALLGVMAAAAVGYGLAEQHRAQQSAHSIYELNLEPVRVVERIGTLMADNRAQILLSLQHDPRGAYAKAHDHPLTLHTDAIGRNIAEITALLQSYREYAVGGEHRKLADAYAEARRHFVEDGLLPARQALLDGSFTKANLLLLEKMNPAYKMASDSGEALSRHLAGQGKARLKETQVDYEQTRNLQIALLILLTAIGIATTMALLRSLWRPMRQILGTFDQITQGNFANQIDISRNDGMGKVLQGLQILQTRMGFEISEARHFADQMTRIKIGLDHVTTNVRIADSDGVVVYANTALRNTLRRDAEAFRRQDTGLDPENIIGYNIGGLYADPAAAIERLRNLTAPAQTQMELGGRLYRLTTAPVLNDQGERLGSVGEWFDIDDQVRAQEMLTDVIRQAAQGDFSVRLHLESQDAFFRQLQELVNRLLQTGEAALTDLAGVLRAVAAGDLTQKMEADYQGLFAQLKDDTNITIERLREVVGRIKEASAAIDIASQEIAAGNQDLSNRTEEQASSLEEAASSMEQINAAVRNNAATAKQANDLAKNSNQIATQGKEAVGQVVATMSGSQASSK
jgi:methyl-accepting chemotaxis protein